MLTQYSSNYYDIIYLNTFDTVLVVLVDEALQPAVKLRL